MQLGQSLKDSAPDCVAHYEGKVNPDDGTNEGFRCLFAEHLMRFIKTPVFALQSKFDISMNNGSYAIWDATGDNILKTGTFSWGDAGSVNTFGRHFTEAVKQNLGLIREKEKGHAVWLDSCAHHCGFFGNISITVNDVTLTAPAAMDKW